MNILQKNFDNANFFHEKKHHLRPYKVSRKTILLGEENYPSFLKRGTMSENASFVIAHFNASNTI